MKKSLLLLFVCLFGALGGVKAWTPVNPVNGRSYYLLNTEFTNNFFYASTSKVGGSNQYFGVTTDLMNATPVKIGESGDGDYPHTLAFYLNNDETNPYYVYHSNGSTSLSTNPQGFHYDESGGSYIIRNNKTTPAFQKTHYRYLDAKGAGSYCDFTNSDSHIREWQFIAVEEAMNYMANYCAGVAEAKWVKSSEGWVRVTSVDMLKTNPENYFFAIFSANAAGLMVDASSNNAENTRPYYKTAVNPLTSSQYLFGIENYEADGFALKSYGLNKYFGNNSDSWNFQNLTEKGANCKLTITLNNGAFLIQSANADWEGRRYWGLYDYTGYTNGQKFAGNKNDAEKGSFLIYRIAKEGLNMTSRIKDPNLDGNLDDWEKTAEGGNGIVAASGGAESWNSSNFNFYQTLTNLPNGYYELGAKAFYRAGNKQTTGAERNVKLYANSEEVAVKNINQYQEQATNPGVGEWVQPTGKSFYVPDNTDAAHYALNTLNAYNNSVVAHVTNGTLTIGVTKSTGIGNDWSYWDTFTLTYLGENHAVVDDDETKTQTYEGAFTENVVVTPTAEYPIVNISGAEFTGTLTADFDSDANGFIIATAEQKAALGDVKNVVVGNTCDNLELTDGVKAIIPAALTQATNATYSRAIGESTNFGTICVPFALTSNDDIQYYTVKSISDGVLTLVETSTVDAGVPAVYKKKGAYAEATNIVITSTDAAIEDNASTQGETVQLIGTFTGLTVGDKGSSAGTAANGNYYIGTDNRFYQGANYITVNPFRAYITGSGENAARLTIQIEDENGTTSIVALEEFENENNLKDGKYLIDGKIVIVKNGVMYSANGQKLN